MGKVIDLAAVRAAKGLTTPANVITEATAPAPAGVHGYHPEMGEAKPNCQIEASLAHYGKHYFLDTPLELRGRGIELLRTYQAKDFAPGRPARKLGWHQYKVTLKAYEAIKAQYSVSYEMLLD